ncbi:carbohydrate-binding module family 1 protein [Paramyrothecium foliicola]|nr:carbohydrate-binding module family 1 protein [Paramyrothecium foliicola]
MQSKMGFLVNAAVLFGLASSAMAQTSLTVNVGTTYQTIDGFGFSQAFGRASEFQQVSESTRKYALDLLFSTTTGAGFSIIRNRIGSGGNGDSILPASPGSPSATPKYTWDRNDRGQFWFTQQAVAYGVKTIYADAWSAPGFMKTSGNEATPGYLCGTTGRSCSSGDWRQAYANFLAQYVKFYKQEGITITHLGFLNEPDYQVSYSQMQISSNAQEAISFIPTLSDTLKSAGLSNVVITCCDAVGWKTQSTFTTNLVNGGSTKYLGVITGHSYSADPTNLSQTNLPKWNTEAGTGGSYPLVTTWYANGALNEGMTWANKLADAIVNAQLSAYLYWEGFEKNQQQSGSHLIDSADGNSMTISGIFWAFAMWSRHIRPGAKRVQLTGSLASTISGAFQNTDGSVVLVFTNSGTATQSARVGFQGFSPSSASAWVTRQGTNFGSHDSSLSGGAVTVSVPSKSVVTVKLTKSGGGSNPVPSLTTTTKAPQASSTGNPAPCSALYGQCGGQGWAGATCCSQGTWVIWGNILLVPIRRRMPEPTRIRALRRVRIPIVPPQRPQRRPHDAQDQPRCQLECEAPLQDRLDDLARLLLIRRLGLALARQRQRHELELTRAVPRRELVDELCALDELDGVDMLCDVFGPVPVVASVDEAEDHADNMALNDVIRKELANLIRAVDLPVLLETQLAPHQRNPFNEWTCVHPFCVCLPAIGGPKGQQQLVTAREQSVVTPRSKEVVRQSGSVIRSRFIRQYLVSLVPHTVEVADLNQADVGVDTAVLEQQRKSDEVRNVLFRMCTVQSTLGKGARKGVGVIGVQEIGHIQGRAGLLV